MIPPFKKADPQGELRVRFNPGQAGAGALGGSCSAAAVQLVEETRELVD
jgi:hypothetical protein